MKAQCERCKQIVELSFAPAAGGIDVACPSCGARYFIAAEAEAADRNEANATAASAEAADRNEANAAAANAGPSAGAQQCPKCGLAQPRAQACRRCGLVFVRWKGAAAAEASVPSLAELDAQRREAAALWAGCEAGFGDDARHDAFLAFCQRTDQLSYAAGCYRAVQAARGAAAEPTATRALGRIEKLAITALELSSRRAAGVDGGPLPYRRSMLILGLVLFLLVGAMLWAIFYQRDPSRGGGDAEERVVPVTPAARRR